MAFSTHSCRFERPWEGLIVVCPFLFFCYSTVTFLELHPRFLGQPPWNLRGIIFPVVKGFEPGVFCSSRHFRLCVCTVRVTFFANFGGRLYRETWIVQAQFSFDM